jgi:hypothetical protein
MFDWHCAAKRRRILGTLKLGRVAELLGRRSYPTGNNASCEP